MMLSLYSASSSVRPLPSLPSLPLYTAFSDVKIAADHNYKKEDIVVLRDNASDPRQHPTKQNMIDAMTWLVKGAHQDDSLFFHCTSFLCAMGDLGVDEWSRFGPWIAGERSERG